MRLIATLVLLSICSIGLSQQLTITNARVIDGTGQVFERSSVLVEDGVITSVLPGSVPSQGAEIDATGLTVIPGLIDTHRHLIAYDADTWYADFADPMENLDVLIDRDVAPVLSGLLAKGVTTIMSPGDLSQPILAIRQLLREGKIRGPRLLAVGPVITSPDDWPVRLCRGNTSCRESIAIELVDTELATVEIDELASTGVDAVKMIFDSHIVPETILREDVAEAVAAQARRNGLVAYAHAESVENMMTAVGIGVTRLVHTPVYGAISDTRGAQLLRDADVAVATTVSWHSGAIQEAQGRERTEQQDEELRQVLENVRYLVDEDVILAFGTDNPLFLDPTEFMIEVRELSKVLTAEEILMTLTRNAAIYLGQEENVGTLEAGKAADIVVLNGNPLASIDALEDVVLVIQSGRLVVDNR